MEVTQQRESGRTECAWTDCPYLDPIFISQLKNAVTSIEEVHGYLFGRTMDEPGMFERMRRQEIAGARVLKLAWMLLAALISAGVGLILQACF